MAEKKATKEPKTFYLGTGRRKTAIARVRVTEGKGVISINGRELNHYFSEEKDRGAVLGPLKVTDLVGRLDVTVKAHGGGFSGQAGAVSQGIARALKIMFSPADEQKQRTFGRTTVVRPLNSEAKARERAKAPTPPPVAAATPSADGAALTAPVDPAVGMLKKIRESGYLTRDARMKERKKYGLRGARRGTQFSKR